MSVTGLTVAGFYSKCPQYLNPKGHTEKFTFKIHSIILW